MMNTYEKCPERIVAIEITAENLEEVREWCNGTLLPNNTIMYSMMEGGSVYAIAEPGQYLIKSGNSYSTMIKQEFENDWRPVPVADPA